MQSHLPSNVRFRSLQTLTRTTDAGVVSSENECTVMKNMTAGITIALYVIAMVAVIVGVDIAFFRNRFWVRLIANIGIVLVFAAFYLRFLRHP
jgi:hypothetical protein